MPDCNPDEPAAGPCSLEQGARIRFTVGSEGDDEAGHSAGHVPPVGLDAPPTSPSHPKRLRRKEHAKASKKTMEPKTSPEADAAPADASSVEAAPAPVAAPAAAVPEAPATQAHTAQAEQPAIPSADDLTKVMGAAGGGGMGLVALVILVVGGTAGWKFWNKFSEQKHEQRMKQMEIDAQEKGLGNAQPIPCQSVAKIQAEAIASLKAQVEELQGKVGKVEKKTASFSGSFDAEELEEWQKKVDKDLKALKSKSKAGA